MSIQSVTAEIISGKFTNEELSSLIDAVKYARSRLGKQTLRALRLGDNVNFTSSRTGQNITGVVTKIMPKNVIVSSLKGLYKVPASMLTVVADEYA